MVEEIGEQSRLADPRLAEEGHHARAVPGGHRLENLPKGGLLPLPSHRAGGQALEGGRRKAQVGGLLAQDPVGRHRSGPAPDLEGGALREIEEPTDQPQGVGLHGLEPIGEGGHERHHETHLFGSAGTGALPFGAPRHRSRGRRGPVALGPATAARADVLPGGLRKGNGGPRGEVAQDGLGGAGEVRRAQKSVPRALGEGPAQHTVHGRRQLGDDLVGRGHGRVHVRHRHRDGRIPRKGRATREHLVEDGPQGVDVRPEVHPAATHGLLGGHVGGRPEDGSGQRKASAPFARGPPPGQPEVREIGVSVQVEEDVGGFDVPVENPLPVGEVQGRGHLLHDLVGTQSGPDHASAQHSA